MLIVGAIIGAGFATGKEISSFFGSPAPPLIALAVGLCLFLLCFGFCLLGSVLKAKDFADVNKKLLKKFGYVADFFLVLNSLIVLSAMLSGMDSLLNGVIPLSPLYSTFSGVICTLIVSKGLKSVINSRLLLAPVMVIIILAICLLNFGDTSPYLITSKSLGGAITYVCMNIMLACTALVGVNEKPKTIFWASLIAAFIMTMLMLFIIFALNGSDVADDDMPLIKLASESKLTYYPFLFAVAASIFTTMTTAMNGLTDFLGKKLDNVAAPCALILGLIVSNLGFAGVINYLYPIIGAAGIIYVVLCLTASVSNRNLFHCGNDEIHDARKQTKNNRRRHDKV